MTHRPMRSTALALACVLALAASAFAGGSASFLTSKRGASGQVYTWQTGHC